MTRQSCSIVNLSAAIFVAGFALAGLTHAHAQTESVIHSFQSSSVFDGKLPLGGLVAANNGALYGTAGGGKYGYGVVYKLVPPATQGGAWKQVILYPFMGSFNGAQDGIAPSGSIVLTKGSKIYGTTQAGGRYGKGTIYEVSPPTQAGTPWTETVLYNFSGGNDGGEPIYGVIIGTGGRLYGTTSLGGRNGSGTVFALAPPAQLGGTWMERVLYSFEAGPAEPSGLSLSPSGALYGTLFSAGTVFQLSPPPTGSDPWVESVLYTFSTASSGLLPSGGLILDAAGALYGVALEGGSYGGGLVYQLVPPAIKGGSWTENVIYSFSPGSGDGAYPESALIYDSAGALYGTTYQGGTGTCTAFGLGCGTVFKLVPPSAQGEPWSESFLYSFQGGSDGAYPLTSVSLFGTNLYGTTWMGGTGICVGPDDPTGCGTIFQIIQP